MGLSEQWIGVCGNSRAASDALSTTEMELLGEHGGWVWARGFRERDLDDLVSDVARRANAAALGGWVADSDCAYLVFATPAGEIAARLAINETRPFGEQVEGSEALWGDLEARRSAFSSLAGWAAKHAPRPIDPTRLAAEMPGFPGAAPPTDAPGFSDEPWYEEDCESGWVFAEDGVRLVYHRLGLPSFDEAVLSQSDKESTDSLGEPVSRLRIWAPDVASMQSIFDRLHPRFDERILVSADASPDADRLHQLLAQQPQGEPTNPPEWLAGVVSELRQCLVDEDIESLQVALVSGGQVNVWSVRAPEAQQ